MPPARRRAAHVVLAFILATTAVLLDAHRASAESIGWPQPDGPGSSVFLTYSFSNLFDAPFLRGVLSEQEVRTATAEAFRLWTSYVPLHFIERIDSGPPPSDLNYFAGDHPDIRIGAHAIANPFVLAHGFLPIHVSWSGLAGDIHFNSVSPFMWGLGDGFPVVDFLEVMAHEIGHAIGVRHLYASQSIMSPLHGFHFGGLGTAFLFPPDVAAAQAIYGAGAGSVHPIPEPATAVLVSTALLVARRLVRTRRPAAHADSGRAGSP